MSLSRGRGYFSFRHLLGKMQAVLVPKGLRSSPRSWRTGPPTFGRRSCGIGCCRNYRAYPATTHPPYRRQGSHQRVALTVFSFGTAFSSDSSRRIWLSRSIHIPNPCSVFHASCNGSFCQSSSG